MDRSLDIECPQRHLHWACLFGCCYQEVGVVGISLSHWRHALPSKVNMSPTELIVSLFDFLIIKCVLVPLHTTHPRYLLPLENLRPEPK